MPSPQRRSSREKYTEGDGTGHRGLLFSAAPSEKYRMAVIMINCLLTGVGGQGTVLLSRLIGAAAMERGLRIRGSETIGMAQRGGSVVSHVRMGENIYSPLIPRGKADVIIAFEPAEAARTLPYFSAEGTMLVLDRAVRTVSAVYDSKAVLTFLQKKVRNLLVLSGETLIERCQSAKVLNVALLGAAVQRELLPFGMADAETVIRSRIPAWYQELNLQALQIGADAVS